VCLVAVTFLGRKSTDDATTSSGSSGSSSGFSDVQHKALVDTCIEGGATRSACECVFTVMEGMYTPDELAKVDEAYAEDGVFPPELARAIQARCS